MITSRQNPKIRQIRALKHRKARQETGLFLVEGLHATGSAMEAGAPIEYLCYSPEKLSSEYGANLVAALTAQGIPCLAVSEDVFELLAEKENPQGILAVVRQQRRQLADFNRENFPWGVALVAPQDPGNLGTILRTVDAAGASGVIILDKGVEIYHPKAVRASMGALFWRPVIRAAFDEFSQWAKANDYTLYGSSAKRGRSLEAAESFRRPAILLLGSEREGLSREQAEVCNEIIQLPMQGQVTSLNLSVAAGILLYAMRETIT